MASKACPGSLRGILYDTSSELLEKLLNLHDEILSRLSMMILSYAIIKIQLKAIRIFLAFRRVILARIYYRRPSRGGFG